MNKNRPTLHRICWTTLGLNFFLEFQGDIDDMRITKKEREQGFASGTLEDAAKLTALFVKHIGVVEHRVKRYKPYTKSFWYAAIQDETSEFVNHTPESDLLELAFNQVADIYVKNQQMWDDAEEVETDEENDEENDEDVSDEDGSDMEDNIVM
jgi:hypothetical protein